METSTPDGLPARWKERAEYLRQFGDPSCAKLWELAASELQAALEASGEQALTLVEAAKLTGLTADYLGQLVRGGKLRNAGRPKAPRVAAPDAPDVAVAYVNIFLRREDEEELDALVVAPDTYVKLRTARGDEMEYF